MDVWRRFAKDIYICFTARTPRLGDGLFDVATIPWLINDLLFHTTPVQLSAAIAILENLRDQKVTQELMGASAPSRGWKAIESATRLFMSNSRALAMPLRD